MILRRIARPMLAAVFVSGGIQTLRDPKPPIQAVEPMLDKTVEQVRDRLPDKMPTDAESLVKLDAMIKIGAGLALAFNKFPRLASLLLAGTLVPTTVATHRFWEHEDPLERKEQQVHFLKNVGLLGGLLIASADTHGKPSLNWRTRRAARIASGKLHRSTGAVQGRVQHAAGAVQGGVQSAAGAVQGTVQSAAGAVQETVQHAAGAVQGGVQSAAGAVQGTVQSAARKPVRKAKSLLPR
jgi:putative oxidoreductase